MYSGNVYIIIDRYLLLFPRLALEGLESGVGGDGLCLLDLRGVV